MPSRGIDPSWMTRRYLRELQLFLPREFLEHVLFRKRFGARIKGQGAQQRNRLAHSCESSTGASDVFLEAGIGVVGNACVEHVTIAQQKVDPSCHFERLCLRLTVDARTSRAAIPVLAG